MNTATNKATETTTATAAKCQICERQFKIRDDGRINMHGHKAAGRGRSAGFCEGSAGLANGTDALTEQVAKLRAEDATRFAGLIGKYEARIATLTASR